MLLSEIEQLINGTNIPQLLTNFVTGIGSIDWVRKIGDLFSQSCRPSAPPANAFMSWNQQAIPLCWMYKKQLYAQAAARNSSLPSYSTFTPDLQSASTVGLWNQLAPNVWPGIDQTSNSSNPTWRIYVDDTWDRIGSNPIDNQGIATPSTATLKIRVPISAVQTFMMSTPNNFIYNISQSKTTCLCNNTVSTMINTLYCPDMIFSTLLTFNTYSSYVSTVMLNVSYIFPVGMLKKTLAFTTSGFVIQHKAGTAPYVIINDYTFVYDPITLSILLTFNYNTLKRLDEWRISIPFSTHNVNNFSPFVFQMYGAYVIVNQAMQQNVITVHGNFSTRAISCQNRKQLSGTAPQFGQNALPFYYEGNYGPINSCGPGPSIDSLSVDLSFGFLTRDMIGERMLDSPVTQFSFTSNYIFTGCSPIIDFDMLMVTMYLSVNYKTFIMDQAFIGTGDTVYNQIGPILHGRYMTVIISNPELNLVNMIVNFNNNWFQLANINDRVDIQAHLYFPFTCGTSTWFNTTILSLIGANYNYTSSVNYISGAGQAEFLTLGYSGSYICNQLYNEPVHSRRWDTRMVDNNRSIVYLNFQPNDDPYPNLYGTVGATYINVVPPFDFLPLESKCRPIINNETVDHWIEAKTDKSGTQFFQNETSDYKIVYIVKPNFYKQFNWHCIIPILHENLHSPNQTICNTSDCEQNITIKFSNCTVHGTTGKRTGQHCYYYESLLNSCQQWYDIFTCGVITWQQALFAVLLAVSIGIISGIAVLTCASVSTIKKDEKIIVKD